MYNLQVYVRCIIIRTYSWVTSTIYIYTCYDGGAPNPYYNRLHSVTVHTYMACTSIILRYVLTSPDKRLQMSEEKKLVRFVEFCTCADD